LGANVWLESGLVREKRTDQQARANWARRLALSTFASREGTQCSSFLSLARFVLRQELLMRALEISSLSHGGALSNAAGVALSMIGFNDGDAHQHFWAIGHHTWARNWPDGAGRNWEGLRSAGGQHNAFAIRCACTILCTMGIGNALDKSAQVNGGMVE
jgi:class 3 adenylate cyclase